MGRCKSRDGGLGTALTRDSYWTEERDEMEKKWLLPCLGQFFIFIFIFIYFFFMDRQCKFCGARIVS